MFSSNNLKLSAPLLGGGYFLRFREMKIPATQNAANTMNEVCMLRTIMSPGASATGIVPRK